MINATFVSRFQHFWRRPATVRQRPPQITRSTAVVTAGATAAFNICVSRPDAQTPFTVLVVQGVLDRQSCTAFLTAANELYTQGCRRLLIDLRGVTRIELAGRFALHNVARLYAGQPLLDPEAGWHGLHDATHAAISGEKTIHYLSTPVLAVPPLAAFLRQADLGRNLAVYANRDHALATSALV